MHMQQRSTALTVLSDTVPRALRGFGPAARAQAFPARTIGFALPFGPGSGTGTSARHFARGLQERAGQAVPERAVEQCRRKGGPA